jgi:hypothetical protein
MSYFLEGVSHFKDTCFGEIILRDRSLNAFKQTHKTETIDKSIIYSIQIAP